MEGYYSTCDYDLIGSCEDCLNDHPGNWYVLLEDLTTCCVSSPGDVKAPRLLDINSTSMCPEVFFLKSASYALGVVGLGTCLGTIGWFARWIFRRCFMKKANEAVNELELENMGETEGDGQAEAEEFPAGEEQEEDEGNLGEGYFGYDEVGSPQNSEGGLSMVAEEPEEEFNLGVFMDSEDDDDDDDYETVV